MIAPAASGQQDTPLVGVWTADQGSQRLTLLLRSDGRYQSDTRSTDPDLDFSSTERGHYDTDGRTLTLSPFDFFGAPESRTYALDVAGDSLTLTTPGEFPSSDVYRLQPGSRADVLAREQVPAALVGRWQRHIPFAGIEEYTFRPDGYYAVLHPSEDTTLPAEPARGRYEQSGAQLALKPYAEDATRYELDFFGATLTLIKRDDDTCQSTTYDKIPGSADEVQARAEAAAAFVNQPNWLVGIWEIRDAVQTVDLTIRPDGHYLSHETTASLPGLVHGRYTLEGRRIHLMPFIGQDLYARSNGEFGKVERTRELDYYDGQLQFIDPEAITLPVTVARQRPGSQAGVLDAAQQAQAERARADWYVGIWEVNDPAGWMDLTFRPDGRYIARAGSQGIPSQVERGRFGLAGDKLSLAPYAGLGRPRGFELDLYAGDLILAGDLERLVIARRTPDSAPDVAARARDPRSLQGERGPILGRWTADLPGGAVELVYRPDGQFRLSRCSDGAVSHDYGLYSVDVAARTLVSDSRVVEQQALGLDYYGETLTIFGGTLGPPSTYTVNLGTVDAAIAASMATDAQAAELDGQWLTRVPLGPRDPNAAQVPTADIPADPRPEHVFEAATVFGQFQSYRRLSPGFVLFDDQGAVRRVAVVNSVEWSFFPTGRAMVRFRDVLAGPVYPATITEVKDSWAAYRVEPKPARQDILHLYADNLVVLETDLGEQLELTVENGRRYLFLGKEFGVLSEWAAERPPEPCQPPANPDPSLLNTGVSLTSSIQPDPLADDDQVVGAPDRT